MTQDEIIEMAREAGIIHPEMVAKHLVAFANLVAAKEREAIAQMIEDAPALVEFAQNDQGGCLMCGFTPKIAAQSVRGKWGRHD
jgi:hypothetical protein